MRRRTDIAYSKVSVKAQTVLPREVRETLAIRPGDTVRYRFTDNGIVIEKASESDDPFAAFTEWAGRNDEEAYGDL